MRPVEIKLKDDAKPQASRFYNIPKVQEKMARTEINRLYTVNVLKKLSHTKDSPWAALSFYQVKKTGNSYLLIDSREVNKCIQGKSFLLSQINESLQKIKNTKKLQLLEFKQQHYQQHSGFPRETQRPKLKCTGPTALPAILSHDIVGGRSGLVIVPGYCKMMYTDSILKAIKCLVFFR